MQQEAVLKIIAMDSSGLVASVAVIEDDILIGEYNVQYKKTHSQTLLPMLDEIREMIDLNMEEIDAIAIAYKPSQERDGSWEVLSAMEKSVSLWSGIS